MTAFSNRLFLFKKMMRQLCWRVALALLVLVQVPPAIANTIPSPLILHIAAPSERHHPTDTFRTISQALDALPRLAPDPNQWVVLQLAAGTYREKIFLVRDKVVLVGMGREQTILQYPELRQHFLKRQAAANSKTAADNTKTVNGLPTGKALSQDWGAAVVNIQSSDIALLDLTVHNSYADENPQDPERYEHQFAVRGFEQATRIITDHCALLTSGADTLSLWNKTNGMYYHSHCQFRGRVDMVCPRGTAFITHSEFINQNDSATLWHDGELNSAQKLVVMYSSFKGAKGFQLGRRHYDGQFYLLHNSFSPELADQPIFRRTYPEDPKRDQPNLYGDRNYFYQNQGPAYVWLHDNLTKTQAAQINADWTFGGQWQPGAQLAQIRSWLQQAKQHTGDSKEQQTHPAPNQK
ncbi:pectin esterase [Rheinheimera riviphila]|uniref:Pectin esterase n=1 Tax=Rheinheimera riviphila TaxID=1834037 RepID=A0A437QFE6_9GAMM|nr:pectin esterase [Rheinheimera riviphila]RVU33261.1 pectin esterase [Rheinheimera riviphila]